MSYRCYVDEIFALFSSRNHADKFQQYLSSTHANINFSIEKEECLPFSDINIFCENEKFATKSIEKRPSVGFIPKSFIHLIKSLFRCFSLFSDFIKFHHEIDKLKSILYKNSFLHDLVDKCVKEFSNKILALKPVVRTKPKKDLVIALAYLSKLSLHLHTRINRILRNKLLYYNIKFVF